MGGGVRNTCPTTNSLETIGLFTEIIEEIDLEVDNTPLPPEVLEMRSLREAVEMLTLEILRK